MERAQAKAKPPQRPAKAGTMAKGALVPFTHFSFTCKATTPLRLDRSREDRTRR
jgi:hypothetical protein